MPAPQNVIVPAANATPLEAHLLGIIERQPGCLTRIGADGTFLAINEVALAMLGAERLEQLLDTPLAALLDEDDRQPCLAFLARVVAGERGSVEVDLTGLGGHRHTVQVHAVPLKEPLDGLPSALCTLRDVTEHRQLERALVDAAAREEMQAAAVAVEREQLAALQEARLAQASAAGVTSGRVDELELQLAEAALRYETTVRQHAEHAARVAHLEHALRLAEERASEIAADAGERERAAAERLGAAEAQFRRLADEATATHARQTEELRQGLADLEAALRESTERSLQILGTYEAERADWNRRHAEAARAHVSELGALQARIAALEQSANEAAGETERRTASLVADVARLTARAARTEQIARLLLDETAAPAARTDTTVPGHVVRDLERALATVLGSEIALAVLPASERAVVSSRADLEHLLLTLAANRRASMLAGGQVTIEIADVQIDEACARERAGFRPGPYVLLAWHASGPGLEAPPRLSAGGSIDDDAWGTAGPGIAGVQRLVRLAGGQLWATREGPDAVALEVYLPWAGADDAGAIEAAPEMP